MVLRRGLLRHGWTTAASRSGATPTFGRRFRRRDSIRPLASEEYTVREELLFEYQSTTSIFIRHLLAVLSFIILRCYRMHLKSRDHSIAPRGSGGCTNCQSVGEHAAASCRCPLPPGRQTKGENKFRRESNNQIAAGKMEMRMREKVCRPISPVLRLRYQTASTTATSAAGSVPHPNIYFRGRIQPL